MKTIALISTLILAGCATGYTPNGLIGGFSEVQLNSETYQINVQGNRFTSNDRAYKIGLLRAAELTLQNGFTRFIILSGGVSSTYAGSTPLVYNQIGQTGFLSGGQAVVMPESGLVIRMVKPNDPAFASALDAELVSKQLKPQLSM